MAEDPFAAGADIDMDKVRALGAADEIKASHGTGATFHIFSRVFPA
jgi:hypothetical protein